MPSPAPSPAPGGALIVGSGGYATIGAAVAAAPAGATIRVRAGVYAESVTIATTLSLIPYGDGAVWLDGGCSRATGLTLDGNNILVRGLGIRNTVDQGVLIHGDRNTVDGNTIQDFDCKDTGPEFRAGIGSWYGGPGQQLTNNTITRRVALGGGNNAKAKSDGIWFKSNSQDRASGGGHLIAGNTITGGWDCIGGETESDIHGSFDKDSTIRQNTIAWCDDDGIQVEGGDANIHVEDNVITHASVGIAAAPVLVGPLYIERNTITEGLVGTYNNYACFKIGKQGPGITYYTGNRCMLPMLPDGSGASGWTQSNAGIGPIVARNNTIVVSRYVIETTTGATGTSFDGDCLWTSDPTRFVKWSTKQYLDLAAFRAGAGQEINGRQSPDCGN